MSLPPDHADSTKRPLAGNIEYYAERRCASGVSPVFNWMHCPIHGGNSGDAVFLVIARFRQIGGWKNGGCCGKLNTNTRGGNCL